MIRSDGTPVTVYVAKQFEVVGVEAGRAGPSGRPVPGRHNHIGGAYHARVGAAVHEVVMFRCHERQ